MPADLTLVSLSSVIIRRVAVGIIVLAVAAYSSAPGDKVGEDEVLRTRLEFRDDMRGYYEGLAQCMTDLGFPTEVLASGEGISSVGDGNNSGALATCEQEVGPHPDMPPPPTEGELREYFALVLRVTDCLKEEGLPATEPPSVDVYVETYLASLAGSGEAPWWPYGGDPDPKVFEVCPYPSINEIYFGEVDALPSG